MQTFNANHAIMSAFSNSQNTETPLSEVFLFRIQGQMQRTHAVALGHALKVHPFHLFACSMWPYAILCPGRNFKHLLGQRCCVGCFSAAKCSFVCSYRGCSRRCDHAHFATLVQPRFSLSPCPCGWDRFDSPAIESEKLVAQMSGAWQREQRLTEHRGKRCKIFFVHFHVLLSVRATYNLWRNFDCQYCGIYWQIPTDIYSTFRIMYTLIPILICRARRSIYNIHIYILRSRFKVV